ncbi:hypothetical protein ACN2XU_17485 [Primorskyibacter sp. 2E107]|uniref:hypothetical protein n=1 Tax=Primorskyibacter sp. 2E107 TaxID=3403458 RepID=UPI003AF7917D
MRRIALCLAFLVPVQALAQDYAAGTLSIELNSVETVEAACRMSFLIQNGHDADIDKAVFEAVLFDQGGTVDRLTLFDFGALPAGRPRVRQFMVPDLSCEALGQVLINGVQSCQSGEAESALCGKGLRLRSRIAVEVIG